MSEMRTINTQELRRVLSECNQAARNGEKLTVTISGDSGTIYLSKLELPAYLMKAPGTYLISITADDSEGRKELDGFPAIWTVLPPKDLSPGDQPPAPPPSFTMTPPAGGGGENLSLLVTFLEKQAELGRQQQDIFLKSLEKERQRDRDAMEARITMANELAKEREKISEDRIVQLREQAKEEKDSLKRLLEEADKRAREQFEALKDDLRRNVTIEPDDSFMRILETDVMKDLFPKIGDALVSIASGWRNTIDITPRRDGRSTVSSTEDYMNRWRNRNGQ